VGDCEHCKRKFRYRLIHNGFNESAYAYCDICGMTALLDRWRVPTGVEVAMDGPIPRGIEPRLAACSCGGAFRASASPRCPYCRQPLSASQASEYLERQASGDKKGWRWQRTWTGLYCIIIENRVVHDVWT
jgi:hypothetical protein